MKKKLILGILISVITILVVSTSVNSSNVNQENIMQINTSNENYKEQENDSIQETKEYPQNQLEVGQNSTTLPRTTDVYITEDDLIYSNKYLVKEKTIYRIDPKTTIEEFRNNIEIAKGNDIKIYKEEKEITSGYVATGMIVRGTNGQEYNLSVIGDITGDGLANQVELTMIIRHLVKIEGCNLEGIEAETADITGDGEIDLVDVNRLINYIVYGKWEYTEVKTPEAPKIEVISEDENAGCYIGKVEVKIEPNSIEEGQRTIYKITGDKTQEETEIKRGEKITLEEEGDYLITAYTYGKAGNRSKGANILIKIRGKYTISYKPGEKGLFSEQTTEEVRYGENTPEFKGQIKGEKGYMFVGWEPKLEEKVTKNVIYTAKWEEIEYKVTFGPNGGDYTIPSEGNAQIKTEITQTNTEGNNNYKLEYVWSQDGEKHPEEGWTEFTNGSEIKKDDITEPGTYYVWVKITDEDGNVVKIIRSDPFIITGPENEANQIKIIPNKTGWTNENVEITIIYGKNLTQNKTVICTGTEGVDFEIIGEERVVVKNNEKQLTVTAEDAAGNKVVATLQINNIDRIKPIVGMSPNGGEHYTMPTTGNAKISSTLAARDLEKTQTDGQSDLGVLQYAWSQSRDNEPEEGWETFTNGSKVEKSDITEPGIWYLWTKVIDNAGNRAEAIKVSNPFVITSNTDPANQIILTPDKTEWTNEDVTVKVTYGANLTENRKLTCTGTSGEDYIVNGLQNVVVKRNKKTITAEAEDVAGNKIVATLKIENIDKDLPIVEMIPNIGIYTMPTVGKAKISTRIIAEDVGDSGLDVLQYAWSTSNTTIPSTGWKNFTNGETVTKTDVDGEGRWYIWVKILDKVGNSCLTVKSNAFRVKPNTDVNSQITLTPDITEWTNRDVTVTAVYGKTLTQNKRLTATGIAGTDFVENGSERIIIKTNQTVTAKAQDAAGNEIQKTLTISNIDKTPPTVTITSPSKDWTKDNISVNLSFADVGSGFKNYQYALTNSATAPSSYGQAITNSTGTVTISNAGEWYLHVKATDNVGNTTGDIVKGPYKIDRTAPTVRVTPETKDWTKDNISISLSFADVGSGFKNYQYALTNSATAPSSYGQTIAKSTDTIQISNVGTWYLHIKATDNVGNVTSNIAKGPYKIERTAPTVTVSPETKDWTKNNISISLNFADAQSGFKNYQYALTKSESAPSSYGGVITNSTGTVTISTEGEWYLHIKAEDVAGNTTGNIVKGPYKLDKTAPTVTVSPETKDWTKDNISISLNFADTGSGFKNYQYTLTNSESAPSSYGGVITNSTGTVTISNAGEWYLHIKATDNATNTTSNIVKGPYKIDKTAPTVTVSPETKNWTNENVSISLNFADTGSGFKNYQYTLTNSESAPSSYGGVITNSTGTVTISTTGEWYLHVKAEDNAKNTTGDIVKGPYKVDKAAPEITEALRGTLQYEAGDIDLSITSKDEVSGFCKIEWYYKVANSSGRYISVKDEADTPMNGANSGLKTAVKKSKKLSLLPDTTYSIYAIIYDVAGNHRESNTITVTTNPARWRNERTKEEYPHMYYALARVDSGDTLTLLCSYTDDYIANVNDDITINLAGYTLTKEDSDINIKANKTVNLIRTGTIKTTDLGVIIENSGTLNISNGSYSSTSGNIIYNYSGGNVSISNGTFTSSADNYPMIYNYGGINITGGSYSSTGSNVIYNRNNGNVSISNGTLTSNVHCIDNRSTLTVRGGEIKSTGDDCNGIYNSGTLTVNGGTIEASKHNAILNYDTTTINGGVIWSTANDQAALGNADGIVYINGGTIKQTGGGIGIFNTAMNGHISSAIITGGTITSTGDTAIVHQTEGELTITCNSTRITNSSINKACITIENSTSVTIGSATSTSTSYPYIYNSAGIAIDIMAGARGTNVKIYSGLIEATNGYAVYRAGTGVTLSILGGRLIGGHN